MIGSRFVVSAEYELLEKLGEGGMGQVYKARQRGPGGFARIVVIKQILPDLAGDERFTEMFLSEARLTARLQHPNIVQVLNLGHGPSGYFLAIEYVNGRPLSKVIERFDEAQPPVGLAAFAVRDVCRALAYAYELPGDDGQPLALVHRDVSPSNVMIGFDGVIKLLDFGVAKSLTQRLRAPATQTGVVKGKLWYLAPERVAGAPFDHRADLFSAGVVLHEALTGERLFQGEGAAEITTTMNRPIPPPSRSNPAVPPALDRIVARALEVDPAKRFSSGRQMAAALDQVLFELKWGAGELAELMRTLFAESAATPTPVDDKPSDTVPLVSVTFEDRTTAPFRPRPPEGDNTDKQPLLFHASDAASPAPPGVTPPTGIRSVPIDLDLDDTTTRHVDPAPSESVPTPVREESNAPTRRWTRTGRRLIIVSAVLFLAAAGALAATVLWPHH